MRFTKLSIKNMLGIKEFEWSGKDIELTGTNETNKSAVIDCIRYLLTNQSPRQFIIRKGADEGEIIAETNTALNIVRKARKEKADYKQIRQGDDKSNLTETFLRQIFTTLQLNPVEFCYMNEQEQNRLILDLIDFKWDMGWIREQFGEIPPEINYEQNILRVLSDIQSEQGYYFKLRQDINREIKDKQAYVDQVASTIPENYNAVHWQSVNLGEMYKRIQSIQSNNQAIEKSKRIVDNYDNKIRGFQADLEIAKSAIDKETSSTRNNIEKQIVEMENRIKALRKDLDTLEDKKQDKLALAQKDYESRVATYEGEVNQYKDKAKETPQDTTTMQEEAQYTEKMKEHILEYKHMVELQEDVTRLNDKSRDLTVKIEHARALPGEILAKCKLPIDGLSIENGIPLIQGLPVSNLSEGRKFELCIDIAAQKEGNLKLLLIDGIEKLSTKRREEVYAKLKAKGVQIVATRTTDEETLQVVEL